MKKKYEGKLAFLEAQQKRLKLSEISPLHGKTLQRLEEKLLSLDKQIHQIKLNFDRDNAARLSEVNQNLSFALLSVETLRQKVKEFEVKAPVDGTISKVFFNNSGEVVSKGSTLGELIPKGRPLIFAARLRPEDIMEVSLVRRR